MSIMLIMSFYTGFFNVRRGWQSLNTGPRFYLRLIRRTGWLWIYTSRTTDRRPFKPKKLSVPFLYPRVPMGLTPFRGLVQTWLKFGIGSRLLEVLYAKSKKKTQVPNCLGAEMSHTGAEVSSISGHPPQPRRGGLMAGGKWCKILHSCNFLALRMIPRKPNFHEQQVNFWT
jgi:hypothetical protein